MSQAALPVHTAVVVSRRARWRRDASVFAGLALLAAVLFAITWVWTKTYQRHEDALARTWYHKGEVDLLNGRPDGAVYDFRNALQYSPDNQTYQLRLAEALSAANYTDQATAYFLNLWDRAPGDGLVNLELARLAMRKHELPAAIRYYHGAIYGVWDDDPLQHRRAARVELIEYLLGQKLNQQAEAEIAALAASVEPKDAPLRTKVAELYLQAGDPASALAAYREALAADPREQPALLGAGKAAYSMGQFRTARRYLEEAQRNQPKDADLRTMLQGAMLVLSSDPLERNTSTFERRKRALDAFHIAGNRLQACAAQQRVALVATPASNPLQSTFGQWQLLNPRMTEHDLREDPDLIQSATDLALSIEQTTAKMCGIPTGTDWALLMLSQYGEGVYR